MLVVIPRKKAKVGMCLYFDMISGMIYSMNSDHHGICQIAGYFEDRRPASNMDPYLVTSMIAETTILG